MSITKTEVIDGIVAEYKRRFKFYSEDVLESVIEGYYREHDIKLSSDDMVSVWTESATNIRNEI